MAYHDIIVVGASAGGVSALAQFVKRLPEDFDAAIFVVLHSSTLSPGLLPRILTDSGALNATYAIDGEEFKKGRIYIAPPDFHLLLDKGNHLVVRKGPKENLFRPSVDALFRSAAYLYGPRVIGIIMSGLLDDGTSGMWNIKRSGGLVILQDPMEAKYPSMPQSVMQHVDPDYVIPVSKMAEVLTELTKQEALEDFEHTKKEMEQLKMDIVLAIHDHAYEIGILNAEKLTTFVCPDCQNALVSIQEGQMIPFRCHTGHAFTANTLLGSITTAVDEKLLQVIHSLEETTVLLNRIGDYFNKMGNAQTCKQFKDRANKIARRTALLQEAAYTDELMNQNQDKSLTE
jgi:two-component system chemotaxis response regulator CheB